ncbi:uncharacterized protein LOC135152253 [Daucus carota subsp. sativus]|uniref:uncharacterized protein LOC135152253 n=1 Tax=Daucus carota subsp. sativus TaxID=79200 RepID=UPI003082BB02
MDMPPVQQQQPQPQQPQPPVSPTIPKQPRSSASRSKRATNSEENPSTKKTRTSVATQVLKTKSDKPATSDAANTDPVNTEAASPQKQKRRRLVAAYDYDDLEPAHATNSEPPPATNSDPSQASPQTKTPRFKRRANKPKRLRVPITEITDFTVEEEQTPSTTLPESSQALMVLPLQAVPLSTATASSTSSEVDEEIICKEQATAEAETPVSDFQIPVSDHGPSTPIPHSPMKIPEGAIVHDTAPENYKSDAVVEEPDKVAVEALQSLAKAGGEPSKSKADVQEKSVQETVEKVANPASDNDEDDDSSDDDNDKNDDEAPLSHLQQKWESTSQYNARLQTLNTNSEPLPRDLQVDPPTEPFRLHKRVFKDLISIDEKYPIQRPLLIPAQVRVRMDMPPVQQQQPQPQQPQPPVSPTIPKQPRSSASRSKRATNSEENPSTKKTRTSVATQVLKTKSDKPATSDAANTDPVNTEAASPQKQKRRRLVAAYDYDDLEPAHATNSEPPPATNSDPSQASPQTKTPRFKRRANKPKRLRVPITEITDFTVEEEQTPSTTLPESSQALMVLPLQAVPLSTATASSTSSEVDEEIICKEQATAEAETPVSDFQIPVSDHGPSERWSFNQDKESDLLEEVKRPAAEDCAQ